MTTVKEGSSCENDAECSSKQYCYKVSGTGQCVLYTQCNRYNRVDTEKARSPTQCGHCLPGYTSEKLGSGEMATLCKKITMQENNQDMDKLNSMIIFGIMMGTLFLLLLFTILGIRLKRRSSQPKDNREHWSELGKAGPSAPSAENSPIMGKKHRMIEALCNNNKTLLTDKNKLVKAKPFRTPSWIRLNPNYDHGLNEENPNSEQSSAIGQLTPVGNNSNNGPPDHQQANGTNYGVEQIDNTMNAALVVMNNLPTASDSDNCNNSNNNSNEGANAGSASGTAPGSSTASNDNQDRSQSSNICISQKITLNVNMLNGDF